MGEIDPSLIDSEAPEEVREIIRDTGRAPATDPALGVDVTVEKRGRPHNRLVVIGDSLSHGFQSGAVFNTDISYPAIIARELGWYRSFRYPRYPGFGGLPLNIEFLLRDLQRRFGPELDWWEAGGALFQVRQFMAQVEDWWERGPGSSPPNEVGINHNLGIYGWDLRDVMHWTAANLQAEMETPKDQLFRQIVENASEIAAIRVLHSAVDDAGNSLTPLGAATALSSEGTDEDPNGPGIETLIVLLGANNALSTVTQLRVSWSNAGFEDPHAKSQFTVWRPSHFIQEFDRVAQQVDAIKARHVIWATVPHVTIAPIARGVGTKVRPGSRYFPYYTRPWISDRDFDVDRDPHITEQQARAIDSAVDAYNEHIENTVRMARAGGKDWYLWETCGLLDRLASRRYIEDPAARPPWWSRYELPAELQMLDPIPDSRFFMADDSGRTQGGLFSLDGVHPSTIGYGILAQEVMKIMELAGVEFLRADESSARPSPVQVNFARLLKRDTLISDPPSWIRPGLATLSWLDEVTDVFSRLLSG